MATASNSDMAGGRDQSASSTEGAGAAGTDFWRVDRLARSVSTSATAVATRSASSWLITRGGLSSTVFGLLRTMTPVRSRTSGGTHSAVSGSPVSGSRVSSMPIIIPTYRIWPTMGSSSSRRSRAPRWSPTSVAAASRFSRSTMARFSSATAQAVGWPL